MEEAEKIGKIWMNLEDASFCKSINVSVYVLIQLNPAKKTGECLQPTLSFHRSIYRYKKNRYGFANNIAALLARYFFTQNNMATVLRFSGGGGGGQ